jgi:hypothetical protein
MEFYAVECRILGKEVTIVTIKDKGKILPKISSEMQCLLTLSSFHVDEYSLGNM